MQGELRQVADLALFAKIVQTGGITRCADDLGMERTTISRRLGSLERTLGVKLLDRSPKHIVVTEAGRRCLEYCEQLLECAVNAQSLATIGSITTSSAPLIVGAPPDILDKYLEAQLREFESGNSGVQIERQPVSSWSDETIESVDLGIALAPVVVHAGWTSKIANIRQSIYASADYVASHPPVQSPFDLENHACIAEESEGDRHSWQFKRGEKVTTVTVNAKFVVPSLLDAREATVAGLGISRLPQYLCETMLRSGQLVDLMPDTESKARDLIVISPRQRQRKTGTTALRMHLEKAFDKSEV